MRLTPYHSAIASQLSQVSTEILPLCIIAAGNVMNDGIAINAAILIFGWMEPLIFGAPFLIVKLLIGRKATNRTEHTPPPSGSNTKIQPT